MSCGGCEETTKAATINSARRGGVFLFFLLWMMAFSPMAFAEEAKSPDPTPNPESNKYEETQNAPTKMEKTASSFNDEDYEEFDVYETAECEAIFGDDNAIDNNQRYRQSVLEKVGGRNGSYYIIHHARGWKQPAKTQFIGLALETIEFDDEEGEFFALFEISSEVAEPFGCEAGFYRVTRDDSIYGDSSVLSIKRNLVLIEHDGDLGYMAACADPLGVPKGFRMVWQSNWTLSREKERSSVRRSSRSSRRRRKYRRRRRRR